MQQGGVLLIHSDSVPDGNLTQYTSATSWLRVFIVCLLTFIPAFTLTLLIEMLPLRPPSVGWKANSMYWIRVCLSMFVETVAVSAQVTMLIPATRFSATHVVRMGFVSSVALVLYSLLLARFWRFPIPFAFEMAAPVGLSSVFSIILFTVGKRKLRENPEIMTQIKSAALIVATNASFMVIYPVYTAVFRQLRGFAQLSFILVLPVIKYGLSFLTMRVSTGKAAAAHLPTVSIELFDALYMFKCMQMANSIYSGVLLIVIDLIRNVYQFWNLRKHVQSVRQDLATRTRVNTERINTSTSRVLSRLDWTSVRPTLTSSNIVAPSSQSAINVATTKKKPSPSSSFARTHLSHELLLKCEHLVIIEFIESAVPMFYAIYFLALFHLPNARYYPEMEHVDSPKMYQTVVNIIAYATLELVSLVYVHAFLWWEFKISALHLLAYVLERDRAILQTVSIIWVMFVLQHTVQHNGIDYSSMYQWAKDVFT